MEWDPYGESSWVVKEVEGDQRTRGGYLFEMYFGWIECGQRRLIRNIMLYLCVVETLWNSDRGV